MKRLLSLLFVLVFIVSCAVIQTSAAIAPQKIGDVDGDQDVTITDATTIQRHLAQISTIYSKCYEAADVDGDMKISIIDATTIQRYLAQIITEFPNGEYYYVDEYFYDLVSDYESGKAMVGMPVTFYASGYCYPEPTSCKLYVNDELVFETKERTEENCFALSYTFEQKGLYNIKVSMCDKWGFGESKEIEYYSVVNPPEDKSMPIITNAYRNDPFADEPVITANAVFGTAPYEYKFTLLINYAFIDGAEDWEVVGETINIQDFSESNKYQVEFYNMWPVPSDYAVIVDVKDAAGNTESDIYCFETQLIEPA